MRKVIVAIGKKTVFVVKRRTNGVRTIHTGCPWLWAIYCLLSVDGPGW